jgi:hypothetical protein
VDRDGEFIPTPGPDSNLSPLMMTFAMSGRGSGGLGRRGWGMEGSGVGGLGGSGAL